MFSGSWTSFHVGQTDLGAEFRAQFNVNASASAVPIERLDFLKPQDCTCPFSYYFA
jgi:hypothetical protein